MQNLIKTQVFSYPIYQKALNIIEWAERRLGKYNVEFPWAWVANAIGHKDPRHTRRVFKNLVEAQEIQIHQQKRTNSLMTKGKYTFKKSRPNLFVRTHPLDFVSFSNPAADHSFQLLAPLYIGIYILEESHATKVRNFYDGHLQLSCLPKEVEPNSPLPLHVSEEIFGAPTCNWSTNEEKDPTTPFLLRSGSYGGQDVATKDKESITMKDQSIQKESLLIPQALHELKNITLTKWGRIKLAAYPQEAIRHADDALLTYRGPRNTFGAFDQLCKEYCYNNKIKPQWSLVASLEKQYPNQSNEPLFIAASTTKTTGYRSPTRGNTNYTNNNRAPLTSAVAGNSHQRLDTRPYERPDIVELTEEQTAWRRNKVLNDPATIAAIDNFNKLLPGKGASYFEKFYYNLKYIEQEKYQAFLDEYNGAQVVYPQRRYFCPRPSFHRNPEYECSYNCPIASQSRKLCSDQNTQAIP